MPSIKPLVVAILFLFLGALFSRAQAQVTAEPTPSNRTYFGEGASVPTTLEVHTQPSSSEENAPQTARYLVTVAEDFVVDVYVNGKLVPTNQRELMQEVFGSIAEKVKIEVKPGDWVVFNVVNDRMRWGTCYFGVAGMASDGKPVFVSRLDDPRWSCCDDLNKVTDFVARKDSLGEPIQSVAKVWADGPKLMRDCAFKDWNGDPIWGKSHNTWIKFVYR